ncbi:hypothetical protein EW026_g2405 [Hermanssonia centrifuga]|uniref:Uncharacterized protein n=1 Tax=Hermanssonia centrifuga TaxID=98765 RepID=A0A4S4KPG6_9APHY|nr:hypothetical protein EW026_g2405 [Hermanssonia centrifuga]
MSQSSTTITLPICTIQTDFKSLIEDVRNGAVPEDTFWISCYKTGEPSVHGKVHLTLNEIDRDLVVYEGTEGVEFEVDGDGSFAAKCSALDISHTKIVMPIKAYSDRLPQSTQGVGKKISAFDVAPDGSRFVTAYDDGSVYISPTSTATSPGTIMSKCHLSTVTSVRFFPSSRVLLTASSDFSLSILSAELPPPSAATPNNGPIRISSVRTFKGHSRGVTSTAIIARGRTILSGSKDGTVRLWDVSSGSQIRMWGTSKFTSIFSTSVGEQGEGAFTGHPDGEESNKIPMPMDPKEVDTADKVAFCGLSDGTFEAFDLGTKLSVFRSSSNRSSSPLHSITYSPLAQSSCDWFGGGSGPRVRHALAGGTTGILCQECRLHRGPHFPRSVTI